MTFRVFTAARRLWFFCAALALTAAFGVGAIAAPTEGVDYRALRAPQPTAAAGKIEVLEFFWYGCPHCNDLEPQVEAWAKRLGRDVVFTRVPVAFDELRSAHSRIYYALEALGRLDLHPKVFSAIHVEHRRLLEEGEIADFFAANGIDRAKWLATYRSFSVIAKTNHANQMAALYQLEGVPTFTVQGKYLTSQSMAGSKAHTLEVVDGLIALARTEKRR